jgi:hypothetical protein
MTPSLKPQDDASITRAREEDRNRHYFLTLIKMRASCLTLLATIGVLLLFRAFEVPLKVVEGLLAGATLTVAGLYLWADGALLTAWSKVFPDPWHDEDWR